MNGLWMLAAVGASALAFLGFITWVASRIVDAAERRQAKMRAWCEQTNARLCTLEERDRKAGRLRAIIKALDSTEDES